MDITKEELAQEQMDQLKAALKKTNSVSNTGAVSGSLGVDTVTLSQDLSGPQIYNNTVIGGGYTLTPSNSSPYYTTASNVTGINWTAGTSATNITANPWATTSSAGRMELNGDNADLVINGVSILDILKDRLNVMIPNPALEKEWTELKALGDKYRALEAKLKEQGEMWAKLKQMPPPDLY